MILATGWHGGESNSTVGFVICSYSMPEQHGSCGISPPADGTFEQIISKQLYSTDTTTLYIRHHIIDEAALTHLDAHLRLILSRH